MSVQVINSISFTTKHNTVFSGLVKSENDCFGSDSVAGGVSMVGLKHRGGICCHKYICCLALRDYDLGSKGWGLVSLIFENLADLHGIFPKLINNGRGSS